MRVKQTVTVFKAKKIITMNPQQPYATAVAVLDGKILAVGELETMQSWFDRYAYTVDNRFADAVLLPGFVEAHMHPQITGLLWKKTYVGYFDRISPDGTFHKGLKTKQEVLDKLREAVAHKKESGDAKPWITAWGYQSEFYNNEGLTVDDLDPIMDGFYTVVENASMHIYYVSSNVLEKLKLTPQSTIPGVGIKDGTLTGEIAEVQAMTRLATLLPEISLAYMQSITCDVARLVQRRGITTMADAAFGLLPNGYEAYQSQALKEDFPVRVVLFPESAFVKAQGGVAYLQKMHAQNSENLSFGPVKFVLDGSVQGYTAHLRWPYYLNGTNGVQNMSVDDLKNELLPIHRAGFQAAMHVNGDQAIEDALAALSYVLAAAPRFDHRHRFEHNQMVTENQLMRMATYGIATNLFVNHVHYWGDLHVEKFLGYDRAQRLNPARSALAHGVKFAFHSDASVTEADPLKTVWIAATRKTLSGKVLGVDETISVYEALRAVTLDAAYLLFQDTIKGSIEVGKLADFVALTEDPLSVPVDAIPNIQVKATVLGGSVFFVV